MAKGTGGNAGSLGGRVAEQAAAALTDGAAVMSTFASMQVPAGKPGLGSLLDSDVLSRNITQVAAREAALAAAGPQVESPSR